VVVAPEIIVAILSLVTKNTNDFTGNNRNVQHFLILCGIYLLNLVLYYLEERGTLELGLFYVGPFWILPISCLVAIRTLKMRAAVLGNIIQVEPFGIFLFLGLAIIGLSTTAYAAATANSPMLKTLEDAILHTHIGFGLALILYIIINFYGLLRQGQPVYRVVYRPAVMPLFTARLAGLILAAAFYLLQGNYWHYVPLAAYNNAVGDVYYAEGNTAFSQQFYRNASTYSYNNHRANYALASLAIKEGRPVPASIFLKKTLEIESSPYAYANLSNLYQQNDLAYDAVSLLRASVKDYPQSGQLYNNLGLRYYQWQSVDSAIYFLNVAAQDGTTREVAQANELALLAQSKIMLNTDSLSTSYSSQGLAGKINLLALLNQQQLYSNTTLPELPDTIWTSVSPLNASLVLNYALQKAEADTALANKVYQRAEAAGASPYEEQWRSAAALLFYKAGRIDRAFSIMQDLADRSIFNSVTYTMVLGQWAMEQNAPLLAADWYQSAQDRGYRAAGIYRALALADGAQINAAKETLLYLPDSSLNPKFQQLKQLALIGLQQGAGAPDDLISPEAKLRLSYHNLIEPEIDGLLAQLAEDDTEALAKSLNFIAENALATGNLERAIRYFQRIPEAEQSLTLKERIALARAANGQAVVNDWPWATALNKKKYQNAAATLATKTKNNPFATEAILLHAYALNKANQPDEAYNLIRSSLDVNKYSIPLLQAYAVQTLLVGLDTYGEETLSDLRPLMPEMEFSEFEQTFRTIADSLETNTQW
jgi:hypothetical protein